MKLSRRDFLKLGGLALVGSTVSCSQVGRQLAEEQLPESIAFATPSGNASLHGRSLIRRFLSRAGYGARPGMIDEVEKIGLEAYLEEQLNPDQLDDTVAELFIRNLTLYNMDLDQMWSYEREDAVLELAQATFYRGLYSKKQLYESMVEFWSDHFNIFIGKNKFIPFLKIVDDRDVIRPYALSSFRELLQASAHSPAMLVYLDNVRNIAREPNENYARELLELHTVGVHGGYTQTDIQELARVLTGWGVNRRGRREGRLFFNRQNHDKQEKIVMGKKIAAGGGENELDEIIEMLVTHPATAEFIATKLARRFVSDDPPASLVTKLKTTFLETDGDIKSILRTLFLSPEFAAASPKFKRPYSYILSVLRNLHVDVGSDVRLVGRWLRIMGQPLFSWPPPDGYPDVAEAWAHNLLPRWNFCISLLAGQIEKTNLLFDQLLEAGSVTTSNEGIQFFAQLLLGAPLEGEALTLFTDYVGSEPLTNQQTQLRLREAIALLLASPNFQWS